VLSFVGRSEKGSSIAFDYILAETLRNPTEAARKQLDSARKAGEPYQYGVDSGGVEPLVERHGLKLMSDLGSKELEQRFLTGSDGKLWGHATPFLAVAHASVAGG